MLIKAITKSYVTPNAVEYATLFDNVERLDVSDTFDLNGEYGPTGDAIVIHYDGNVPIDGQQRYVRMSFFENGRPRILYSANSVYVMNDAGKTIQSYHPVNVTVDYNPLVKG